MPEKCWVIVVIIVAATSCGCVGGGGIVSASERAVCISTESSYMEKYLDAFLTMSSMSQLFMKYTKRKCVQLCMTGLPSRVSYFVVYFLLLYKHKNVHFFYASVDRSFCMDVECISVPGNGGWQKVINGYR